VITHKSFFQVNRIRERVLSMDSGERIKWINVTSNPFNPLFNSLFNPLTAIRCTTSSFSTQLAGRFYTQQPPTPSTRSPSKARSPPPLQLPQLAGLLLSLWRSRRQRWGLHPLPLPTNLEHGFFELSDGNPQIQKILVLNPLTDHSSPTPKEPTLPHHHSGHQ